MSPKDFLVGVGAIAVATSLIDLTPTAFAPTVGTTELSVAIMALVFASICIGALMLVFIHQAPLAVSITSGCILSLAWMFSFAVNCPQGIPNGGGGAEVMFLGVAIPVLSYRCRLSVFCSLMHVVMTALPIGIVLGLVLERFGS